MWINIFVQEILPEEDSDDKLLASLNKELEIQQLPSYQCNVI